MALGLRLVVLYGLKVDCLGARVSFRCRVRTITMGAGVAAALPDHHTATLHSPPPTLRFAIPPAELPRAAAAVVAYVLPH